MVERIKEIIEYSQLSSAAFADMIGISRSGLTHLLTGRNQPSLDVARKILAKFPEISTEWLIMGMGAMLRPDEQPITASDNIENDVTSAAYPNENSKFDRQTDLFGEFENPVNTESDVQDEVEIIAEHEVGNPVLEAKDVLPNVESVVLPRSVQDDIPVEAPQTASAVRKVSENRPATPVKRDRRTTNATPEKKLQKIVFFYDDHSFEVFSAC